MECIETGFKDVVIIKPKVFGDERGFFMESFNEKTWKKAIPNVNFVQDNESFSVKGVLRGFHFQKPPFAQAKLVRVIKGSVLDVIIDLRKDQATYGQHLKVELSEENKNQLYVPRGFAHSFLVLSETALFSYKCDNYYNKESEGGLYAFDPGLNIEWPELNVESQLSEKDQILPKWGEHFSF